MDIIFHCDDAGASINITKHILKAWEKNLIHSFSIIANGDGTGEIIKKIKELPDYKLRVAVHLNLGEGKPLSPHSTVLLDKYGNMHFHFIDLLLYWLFSSKMKKNILLNEIEQEWRAQIERVRTLCYPHKITSIDSHIHIHIFPFLYPLVMQLAKEYNIPEIRLPIEILHISNKLSDSLSINFLINIIKYYVLKFLTRYSVGPISFKNNKKYIIGILYSGRMTSASVKAGIKTARKKGATSIEIIFHIGRAERAEENRWKGNYKMASAYTNENREKEYYELLKLRREIL